MVSYDTNLKVTPPLRNKTDMMALREAVESGVVDCITSHHLPQNWDNKTCEFEYAANGMIGLQTSFVVLNQLLNNLAEIKLADLMGNNARKLFNLSNNSIEIGGIADFTLFTKEGNSTLMKEINKSKSANSAFFNVPLAGKVVGVYTKGRWNRN
jgi:dihydroorotase